MKYLKVIAGIIATILLGAIGSGLWERVLSPALDKLSRSAIQFVDGIYTGYLDSIYKSAAYDLPNIYQQKIAALLFIVIGIAWAGSLIDKFNWWERLFAHLPEDHRVKFNAASRGYFLGMALSIFAIGMFLLSKTDYVQKTISYSHQSLEILHPYIGTEKYLLLKSEYYRVTSAAAFEQFNSQIIALSKHHQITLPKFQAIE